MSEDRDPDAAVAAAAEWLANEPTARVSKPVVPYLQQTFGLCVAEAVEACRRAHALRMGRAT